MACASTRIFMYSVSVMFYVALFFSDLDNCVNINISGMHILFLQTNVIEYFTFFIGQFLSDFFQTDAFLIFIRVWNFLLCIFVLAFSLWQILELDSLAFRVGFCGDVTAKLGKVEECRSTGYLLIGFCAEFFSDRYILIVTSNSFTIKSSLLPRTEIKNNLGIQCVINKILHMQFFQVTIG